MARLTDGGKGQVQQSLQAVKKAAVKGANFGKAYLQGQANNRRVLFLLTGTIYCLFYLLWHCRFAFCLCCYIMIA